MEVTIFIAILMYLSVSVDGQKEDIKDKLATIFNKKPSNGTTTTTTTTTTAATIEDKNPGGGETSEDCECVPYYLCNKNNSIITDGTNVIDIRGGGDCDSYLEQCCKLSNKIDKPILPPIEKKEGCGYRNENGVGFRITGDKDSEAQFGEFPWMVAVLTEDFNAGTDKVLNVYKCGGALIHPQVVLTGAHCVVSKEKKYKVRAGEWDTQTTKELLPHQDRLVKDIVRHDKFNSGSLFNDVALLFLESPFDIVENVNTLCLPEQGFEVKDGTRCFASGWGRDKFEKDGIYQIILKKVDLPIVEHARCQHQLRTTRLGKHFELDKSFVCAGGEEGKDTCKGDGGSPLVCPIPGKPNRYQNIGLVAWGIGCNEKEIPGVYANVGLFRHWIDEHMSLYNFDSSYYKP